jgi:hypothetical protein
MESKKTEMIPNLEYRIKEQLESFGNNLPERYAIAWRGYLGGLFEWGMMEYPEYRMLLDLLPKINEPNPVSDIFIFDQPDQDTTK